MDVLEFKDKVMAEAYKYRMSPSGIFSKTYEIPVYVKKDNELIPPTITFDPDIGVIIE